MEVKTTLRAGLVDKSIKRLQRAKRYLPECRDHKVFGAVAYLRAEQGSDRQAKNQGLFVILATGDSTAIASPKGFASPGSSDSPPQEGVAKAHPWGVAQASPPASKNAGGDACATFATLSFREQSHPARNRP